MSEKAKHHAYCKLVKSEGAMIVHKDDINDWDDEAAEEQGNDAGSDDY